MLTKIAVSGVLRGHSQDGIVFLVVLSEVGGGRKCIMTFDADNIRFIQFAQQHIRFRGLPVAHSAIMNLLGMAGIELRHLIIPPSSGSAFRTVLHFKHKTANVEYELLPSDAVAMAMHADCPIFIDDDLLNEADPEATKALARFSTAGGVSSTQSAEERMMTLPTEKLPQS